MELRERSVELAIMEELVKDRVLVTVHLTNGAELRGIIAKHDMLVIVLFDGGVQKIVYKHSISSITPICMLRSAQPKK